MTREERYAKIAELKESQDFLYDRDIALLIELLEQEPCEDCISRKEAIKSIEWWFGVLKQNPDILIDSIKTLPNVQPTRIHEKWEYADAYNYRCRKCKHVSPWDYAYCPYCGAQMDLEDN